MLDIREGDKWKTRSGEIATIEEEVVDTCTDYCWEGKCMGSNYTWTSSGKVYRNDVSDFDLIELYYRHIPEDNRDSLEFFRSTTGGKHPYWHTFET